MTLFREVKGQNINVKVKRIRYANTLFVDRFPGFLVYAESNSECKIMPKCNFDRDMGVEDAFYTYPGRPWPSAPVDLVFVNKLSNAKSDCFRLNL